MINNGGCIVSSVIMHPPPRTSTRDSIIRTLETKTQRAFPITDTMLFASFALLLRPRRDNLPLLFPFFSFPLSLYFFFSSFSSPAFSANAKRIASHNSWMISAGLEGEGPSSWWLRVDDMEIFEYPMDSSIVYIVARLSAIVVAVCPWCRGWTWRNIEESQQRRRMFDGTFSEDRERLLTIASFLMIAR